MPNEFKTQTLATVGGEWPAGTEETIILGSVAFTTPSGIFVACVKGAKGWFLQHDLMAPPMSFTAALEAARLWLLETCVSAAHPLPEGHMWSYHYHSRAFTLETSRGCFGRVYQGFHRYVSAEESVVPYHWGAFNNRGVGTEPLEGECESYDAALRALAALAWAEYNSKGGDAT